MATRLYRCNNCGQTFSASKQACAACQIDVTAEPRFLGVVVPIETIHFDPPHPTARGFGTGFLACQPRRSVAGSRATGEPSVVNCAACRETAAWKKADAAGGSGALVEQDEVITPVASEQRTILTSPCE